MDAPPLTVSELRIAVVAGPRLRQAAGPQRAWQVIGPHDDAGPLVSFQPDLALLEIRDPGDHRDWPQAAARFRRTGVPTALWLTDVGAALSCPPELAEAADVVFCCDPGQAARLPHLGSRPVVGLPHAASTAALTTTPSAPAEGPGLVVEPEVPWSRQFPRAVEPLLEAARPHGLSALAMEPVAPGIPTGLFARIESATDERDRLEFMRQCGAIIAASPPTASRLYVPEVVFDAIAMGLPVIVPRNVGSGFVLPGLAGVAESREEAHTLISLALENGELSPGRRDTGSRSIHHEHTYEHRLATIASAFSWPVLPPVWRPAR